MPYFGYRRLRRYRRYRRFYRRYRRGFRRSYARKYVNSSSRSNVRLKCSVESNFELASGTSAAPGDAVQFCPLQNSGLAVSALKSPLYRTYCSLYEEVKVIGFKSQISIASVIGGADLPSLQIYTAFDRKRGATEDPMTADEIKNSSTYLVSTALNNNVAKIVRSIYASDLMEKAMWHDSTLSVAGGVYSDAAYEAAAANPNFFVPAMSMCFQAPTLGAAVNVKVNVSTVFYFAFRNPKYGGGAVASKVQDLGGIIRDREDPDGDGDVDVQPPAQRQAGVSDSGRVVPAPAAAAAAAPMPDDDDDAGPDAPPDDSMRDSDRHTHNTFATFVQQSQRLN